jgi:threonine dehydratase
MIKLPDDAWVAGVDGCKGGWVVALGQVKGKTKMPFVVSTIQEVLASDPKPSIVAIDVPIGLPTRSPAGGRKCEPAIRAILRGKANSVFRVPCRSAIYKGLDKNGWVDKAQYRAAYDDACNNSEDETGFSLQSLYIFNKIAEVDKFLAAKKAHACNIYEAHPELAFYCMNGKKPVMISKTKKLGFEHRRLLLERQEIPLEAINHCPKYAKRDDVADAFACLVTARCLAKGKATSFPDKPCKDDTGLLMAIWACCGANG